MWHSILDMTKRNKMIASFKKIIITCNGINAIVPYVNNVRDLASIINGGL